MSKSHKIKKLSQSFFCILLFCWHLTVCNAAVVGYSTKNFGDLRYIDAAGGDAAAHAAAVEQIHAVRGDRRLVFSTQGGDGGVDDLRPVIHATLAQIFNPHGGGGIGGHIIANHTNTTRYTSGAEGGETDYLFAHQIPQIVEAYSGLPIENQGAFQIQNGVSFHHTEPKALDYLLGQIYAPQPAQPPVRNVLLISRLPLCACCTRLLLSVLNHRRAAPQNIVIMSHDEFRDHWRPHIGAGAHTAAILADVDGIMAEAGGNKLALLVRY